MKQGISDFLKDIAPSAFALGFGYMLLRSFRGPNEVPELISLYLLMVVPIALLINGIGQSKSRRAISALEMRLATLEDSKSNT